MTAALALIVVAVVAPDVWGAPPWVRLLLLVCALPFFRLAGEEATRDAPMAAAVVVATA